jgi:serine protease Do
VISRTSNIGFAVPINQAVEVLPQLKTNGRVSRGYMGVGLTDVTPSIQRALGLSVARGALVQDVTDDSPANRSGVRVYDVIVDVEGHDIQSNDDLIRDISARQPGSVARVQIVRDGRRLTLPVRLTERPPFRTSDDTTQTLPGRPGVRPAEEPDTPLGITVREVDRSVLGRLQIPESIEGVLVSRIDPTGAASSSQIRPGFIIVEINRRPVRNVADYQRIVTSARAGEVLAILYYDPAVRQRAVLTVTVE